MNEILSSTLWPRLKELAKTAHKKFAAVAYVTDDEVVKFGKGDVLVTDASDEAIKTGQTSAAVLTAAWRRKATIYSIPKLHSKLYIFDRYVIVGSANLSKSSQERIEIALLTDHPTTVSASRLLIDRLKQDRTPIDEAFISHILGLPVTKHPPLTLGSDHKVDADILPTVWLVGLKPAREKEDEQAVVEEGLGEAEKYVSQDDSSVSWIRFRGNSRFRRVAQRGDVVVRIWTEDRKGKPKAVYHHAPILLRKEDPAHNTAWFYVEDYPDAEETTLSWNQFRKLYSKIGIPGKLSQWSHRELAVHHSDALHDLWFDQK
jgi:hypothetical protein